MKDKINKELLERAKTKDDVYPIALTSDMSREEIKNTLLKMHYIARKETGLDVSNHPYLKTKEQKK